MNNNTLGVALGEAPNKPITTADEFFAEAERLGVTMADLLPGIRKRLSELECKTSDGVPACVPVRAKLPPVTMEHRLRAAGDTEAADELRALRNMVADLIEAPTYGVRACDGGVTDAG
jgi:hypothetical protein